MLFEKNIAGVRLSTILLYMMALGLFVLISGKVWLTSGSARNTQIYIWLLLPALCLSVHNLFQRRNAGFDGFYLPWLAFLAWVALSSFWGIYSGGDAINLAKRGLFIILFFLSILFFMHLDQRLFKRVLMAAIFVVSLGALATIIYQFFWLDRPLGYRTFRLDRLGIGEFANYRFPVAAGIFHGALAVWAFGMSIDRDTRWRAATFWFLVFVTFALFTFFTYARGAWIGMTCGAAAAVILQNTRKGWWAMGGGVVLAVVVCIAWYDYLMIEIFKRQLSGRGPIWDYYFDVMPGHWWTGFGLGTPFEFHWSNGETVSPHAHSLYLQQIYDSGVIAILFMAAGVVSLAFKAWQLRAEPWVRLALPAFLYALIVMLTDIERIFTRPGDYWTVVWLPVAILLAVPRLAKGTAPEKQ